MKLIDIEKTLQSCLKNIRFEKIILTGTLDAFTFSVKRKEKKRRMIGKKGSDWITDNFFFMRLGKSVWTYA